MHDLARPRSQKLGDFCGEFYLVVRPLRIRLRAMRIQILVVLLMTALLTACRTSSPDSVPAPARAPDANLAKLLAEYHEERLKLYPMDATMAGDHRYDDLLPNNLTESFRAAEAAFYRKYLAALEQVDRSGLADEDRMSCDVLRWECETKLEQLRFPTHLLPVNQFSSLHLDIGQWAGGTSAQPFKTVRDYENWLQRLDAFTRWCHTAITNMQTGNQVTGTVSSPSLGTIPVSGTLSSTAIHRQHVMLFFGTPSSTGSVDVSGGWVDAHFENSGNRATNCSASPVMPASRHL